MRQSRHEPVVTMQSLAMLGRAFCHAALTVASALSSPCSIVQDSFYMDRLADERDRGVTIMPNTKEFNTARWIISIIDAPGRHDIIMKYIITGASLVDVAPIMVPADGLLRQLPRRIYLSSVKQICFGEFTSKCAIAGYRKSKETDTTRPRTSCSACSSMSV